MQLIYNGALTCAEGQTAFVKEFLEDKKMFQHLECFGKIEILVEDEILGDISTGLKEVFNYFKERNVLVDGEISYTGDYDGKYEIQASVVNELDEEACVIQQAETSKLIQELERRGYMVKRHVPV